MVSIHRCGGRFQLFQPGAFFDPTDLDIDSSNEIAFIVANGYRAVMAVDPTTGERVIVAR
jgi:hypothetical protein